MVVSGDLSMQLVERVRRTIRRHGLVTPQTRVLVALSGGSDSVALLSILKELAERLELRLAGAAHFNHQLRETAGRDERLALELSSTLGLPCLLGQEDVRARAKRERRSIEDAARAARYEFLARARLELSADVIAFGHTKDDQAETVLLRLLRGAGPRGLAAMYPRMGLLVRPLLECRRHELRAYLEVRHLSFVDDESNTDVAIPRNRVRAELLPLLGDRFNPSIVDVLADEAELARENFAYLDAVASEWLSQFAKRDAGTWHLDLAALRNTPTAIARIVLWRTMSDLAGTRSVCFADVGRALELALCGGGAFDGPRQRVQRLGSDLVLTGRAPGASGRPVERLPADFHYPLTVPGYVGIPEADCSITAEVGPQIEGSGFEAGTDASDYAIVRQDRCGEALGVRNRRPGDKFRPLGSPVRRKLQDFLVDRKVPRGIRDAIPIVVDASGRLVWVAGHAVDEGFRVTDPAQAVVILRVKAFGGST